MEIQRYISSEVIKAIDYERDYTKFWSAKEFSYLVIFSRILLSFKIL